MRNNHQLERQVAVHFYYCRGCGLPLPLDFHGLFHRDCLQKDKRRRVQEQRRLEEEKFQGWVQGRGGPRCGLDGRGQGPSSQRLERTVKLHKSQASSF